MSPSREVPLFDGFEPLTPFNFSWFYVALNPYAIGKFGISRDRSTLPQRLSSHAKAADMREVLRHRTPNALQIESSLCLQLEPYRVAGREWIDFSQLHAARLLCDTLEVEGIDTLAFRVALSQRLRGLYLTRIVL